MDVVVPFVGADEALTALAAGLARLELRRGDTVTVVDNRRRAGPAGDGGGPQPRLLRAPGRRSSYYARNRGAASGSAEWLLFVDADVEAPADLLDRYFRPLPGAATAVLAGGIVDAQAGGETGVSRFLIARSSMDHANTLRGERAYAQTANCAVRRVAFEAAGGFTETIRSGGDADLCFRLVAAGWELERRDRAQVAHRTRTTLRALIRQRARHGAGAAWLERRYPGSFPGRSWSRLARWTLRELAAALGRLARGDRDRAARLALEPVSAWAFALGRLGPNRARPGR